MNPDEIPRPRDVIARDWPTAIPLIVLLAVLFSGYTPYLAAFWGITACLAFALTQSKAVMVALLVALLAGVFTDTLTTPLVTGGIFGAVALAAGYSYLTNANGKAWMLDAIDAFILGAKYAISVGAAAATVGIIVGVVTLTGVGFKISNIVTSWAGDLSVFFQSVLPFLTANGLKLFFTLLFTAIVCILLGCGVPTTPTYIIMVTVAAPALTMLGVEPIVAHFFVFYYGVLADVTPPVALAAYAGASMAGADPFKTGNTAFRLALGKALVPFVFAFSPSMLLVVKNFSWQECILATVLCIASITLLSAAFTGYVRRPMTAIERWLAGIAGLLMIMPTWPTVIAGAVLAGAGLARQAKA